MQLVELTDGTKIAFDDDADDEPIVGLEADPYVWVEPFRDLTLEEFRARERIKFETAERLRVELSDKLQETLKSVPIGSMIKTHDNRNWIVQETPDGRRVMLIDTRSRKVRRAAEKAEGTIRL